LKNIDRVLIGVLAPAIKVDFALSDSKIGLLSMAFAVAYAIFGIPIGRWADRSPRKLVIATVVTLWSLMTAICGLSANYIMLFFGRMGVAVGEAGYLPAAYTMVSDYLSPRLRNLALGILTASSSIGVGLGLALGGWLASSYGWRTAFLALGLPGLIVAAIVYFALVEPVRGGSEPTRYDAQTPQIDFKTAIGQLMRNRLYLWIVVTSAFNTFSAVGMVQWLPSFFNRVHHLPMSTVGFVFGAAFSIGMVIGQLSGAVLATRIARRGIFRPMSICIWSNLILVPAYFAALWLPFAGAAMTMTIVAAFMGAIGHAAMSAASQTALPPGLRGLGHAVLGLLVSIVGMGIGPLLIGVVSDLCQSMHLPDPLRYALSAAQIMFLIAAFSGWRAYRLGTRP
jgi:predicted MFS family arabinose efflux permease